MCRGFVDTLPAIKTADRVSSLRLPVLEKIKELFGVTLRPPQIRLRTTVQDDGAWSVEEDVSTARSGPTRASNLIGAEFRGAGGEGQVQLLVDFADPLAAQEPEAQSDDEVPPSPETDGNMSDVESAVARFNNGCVKNMAFSEFNATRIKRIFKGMEARDYFQQGTQLPPKLDAGIRAPYQDLVMSSKTPWLQENEALKRH
ncbi:hypothetical protein PHYPSEUDO_003344 [Phytophthora pseudosyringae]|uniref:Uncharacterized protein n=1 Tax=Phytophthora pseudosyringae TaxID=221518 RepID=A0A8T1VUM8_9STRA|nr:hypothetical protein PHYPSEUDO_003344 [Phytophthora pseudosyringae]